MELTNRNDLEEDFALTIARLNAKQRKELEAILGTPPSVNNVNQEFWDKRQREMEEALLLLLLLIGFSSYTQHGGVAAVVSVDDSTLPMLALQRFQRYGLTDEPPAQLVQWATRTASDTSAAWAKRSQKILQKASDNWAAELAAGEAESQGQAAAAGVVPKAKITDAEILEKTLEAFGPDRAARIATTETTRAQHQGSEHAIATTVGLSDEDRWFTSLLSNVCPVCEPLHGTPRSYWGRFFPGGPPSPHVGCNCYVVYHNAREEMPTR